MTWRVPDAEPIRSCVGLHRVLLVRLDHAGDCVLTVPPVAAALKAVSMGMEIHVLTTPSNALLIRGDPHIARVVECSPPWSAPDGSVRRPVLVEYADSLWHFVRSTRRALARDYDAVLHLSCSHQERWLTLGLSPVRIGFDGLYASFWHRISTRLLTATASFDPNQHLLDNCFSLARLVCPELKGEPESKIVLSRDERATVRSRWGLMSDEKVLGIHPGGRGSMKNWPLERFVELISLAIEAFNMKCLIFGGPGQAADVKWIAEHVNSNRAVCAITPDFRTLAAGASLCDVFVGNDGGPVHIAAAVGTPTVAIFGPTSETIYGPLGRRARVVRKPVACAPCTTPWRKMRRAEECACLERLTVEEVLKAMREVSLLSSS